MACRFCEEFKKNKLIISSSDHAFALLSNPRLVEGQSLVIPKRHVEYPGELTDNEIIDIFQLIEKIRKRMLDSGMATGVDIRQNYRPFLTQSRVKVDHIHFHVLPRTNEDELYGRSMRFETELFTDLSAEEINKVRKQLT
jgi:diadenosine tetraphosphate (Ap4A) HIT family hydrolase